MAICIKWRGLAYVTRNSAITDKPGEAFRGQSMSPDMVGLPFHMLGMVSLLVCCSNFERKTHHFEIFDFKNAVTLKIGLRVREGH